MYNAVLKQLKHSIVNYVYCTIVVSNRQRCQHMSYFTLKVGKV